VTVTVYVPIPVVALVEMVITTACDEVPGVTEVDGLKRHAAPAGSPAEQDRVTESLNDAPKG
jgi:hypothetical protein